MAPSLPCSVLTLCLLFTLSFAASSSPSSSSNLSSLSSLSSSNVSLSLYYETLCPGCSNFIVNHLANIFDDGLIEIVDLNRIPFGNARVRSNGTVSCQVQ
ncbi:GILT-like protein F37H8.5 [Ananas comosus]|uniref:GILT-like protein F37H8.5 n=1 Tax=Ananas comosus TaxID=4615 RepID=A0A199VB16_ANACO|nr:GILT-like protein F37H8.5 [Ananas comosus]